MGIISARVIISTWYIIERVVFVMYRVLICQGENRSSRGSGA